MFSFGSGVLIGTPLNIPNATPVNFGLVNEVTIEDTASTKELYGQYQRAIAIARGTIKTTGKAKVARISGLAFASLYFGLQPQLGQTATQFAEAATIPATAPFTYTPSFSTMFVQDEGVVFATCLDPRVTMPLIKVAPGTTPATGQYSVTGGVYTFAAADAGIRVLVTYTYTIVGTGQSFTVTNQLLGTTPNFSANFFTTFGGRPMSVQLNSCISNKLSYGTKLEDFVMPEFDFSVQADACGNVMTWSFADNA